MSETFDLDAASGSDLGTAAEEAAPATSDVGEAISAGEAAADTGAVADTSTATPTVEYEPSWLDEISGAMDTQYAQPPMPPPGYPGNYPPQYDPGYYQPPPPPAPKPESELDAMLQNPRGFIADIAQQATAGQQQYVRQMEGQVNALMRDTSQQAFNSARSSVESGYRDVLNKDSTFLGNKNVRDIVDGMLGKAMNSVQQGISRGDFRAGTALSDPTFFPALLYTAKLKAGAGFSGGEPMMPAGANIETVSPPQEAASGPALDADLQGVADALGPAFEKELKASIAEADKRGDMVW